jgi:YbbR domain-containing protein
MRPNLEKTLYSLLCLLLAILLAVYVGEQRGTNITRGGQVDGKIGDFKGLVSTKKATINAPLQLNGLDTDKYYVAGAPETVKIEVEGAAALVTTAQNTKNFQVYADLTDLDVGEHQVKLKESGLNDGLTFKIIPER